MKIYVLAGILLLGTAGFTFADEAKNQETPETTATEARTTFDWSGLYAGVNIGYGWGKSGFVDREYNGLPPAFPIVRWEVKSNGRLAST